MTDKDLLSLYLGEAKERLDRLRGLIADVENEHAVRGVRRELHTLKGASRMIGLGAVADICHQAEDALGSGDARAIAGVRPLVDRVEREIAALAAGLMGEEGVESEPSSGVSAPYEALGDHPISPFSADDVRIPRTTLDRMSDECARLRVISESAGGAVKRLDELAQLSERGIASAEPRQVLAGLATNLRRLSMETERARRLFEELVDRQLDTLLSFQVQPVGPFLRGLAHHIEDLAVSQGKQVEVRIEGSDCRLDRRIVEALREALLHLARNAVDHGLEDGATRKECGKPGTGVIILRADASRDRFRFEVSDDGRGIDPDAVLDEAVRGGLIEDGVRQRLDPGAILQLLFRPGLSTRKTVDDVSGRGVGLDVVAASVRRVGGEVWVDSEVGSGTRFTLDLPVARRGERVTVVEAAGFQIALPSAAIRGFSYIRRGGEGGPEEGRYSGGERPGSRTLDLAQVFGGEAGTSQLAVELTVSGRRFGILVDRILGEEEVFVRAFPDAVGPVSLLEGMALLSRGQAVGVLDVSNLDTIQLGGSRPVGPAAQPVERLKVMLVDDSRVTRELVRRMLVSENFAVTAVDSAAKALKLVQEVDVDCLVTDIDMPGMDGLTLTRELRNNASTAHLPIVLISTAGGSEDRLAGLEAGADAFVVKQRLDRVELSKMLCNLGGRPPE